VDRASDQTVGPWAGGGVSDAQVTLFDKDVQAGGFTYGLLLGWAIALQAEAHGRTWFASIVRAFDARAAIPV